MFPCTWQPGSKKFTWLLLLAHAYVKANKSPCFHSSAVSHIRCLHTLLSPPLSETTHTHIHTAISPLLLVLVSASVFLFPPSDFMQPHQQRSVSPCSPSNL